MNEKKGGWFGVTCLYDDSSHLVVFDNFKPKVVHSETSNTSNNNNHTLLYIFYKPLNITHRTRSLSFYMVISRARARQQTSIIMPSSSKFKFLCICNNSTQLLQISIINAVLHA